jgi:hypothetical protein
MSTVLAHPEMSSQRLDWLLLQTGLNSQLLNNTGNFAGIGPQDGFLASSQEQIQCFATKFPPQRNREFLEA